MVNTCGKQTKDGPCAKPDGHKFGCEAGVITMRAPSTPEEMRVLNEAIEAAKKSNSRAEIVDSATYPKRRPVIRYFLETDELRRSSELASGYDVVATANVVIKPGRRVQVPTGIYLALEPGVEAQMRSRSGLALKHGIVVSQGIGTIDADYRGEVVVCLSNTDWSEAYEVVAGDRVAQIVFCPVLIPESTFDADWDLTPLRVPSREELGATKRNEGGHGSTGR